MDHNIDEQLIKRENETSSDKPIDDEEFEYPPISYYVPFCLMINCQALGFGATVSFTGPTLDDIANDLSLCGTDDGDDGDDDEALCNKAALVAAVYALGAIGGAILAGPMVNHPSLGRRPVYLMNLILFIGGYTLIGLSQGYTEIILGRLITGFASGVSGVVTPMYVGEISPPQYRGILGAFFNIGIAAGILGVNVLTFFGLGWRKLAYLYGTIPQGIILCCFLSEYWFPESPEHLTSLAMSTDVRQDHSSQVGIMRLAKSLERLHSLSRQNSLHRARSSVEVRLRESKVLNREQLEQKETGEGVSFFDLYGHSLILGLGITSGFALSAVNCLSAFAGTIFELAGTDPGTGNVAFASVQLGVAIMGICWFYEKYGRRTLLLTSAAGCTVGHLVIFIAFTVKIHALAVAGMMLFIGSVSIGLGSLSWVYASEIFPNSVRPLGMTLAGVSFWGITFLLSDQFPEMIDFFGKSGCFLVFAGLSAGVFAFVWICLIETRGRSLEEIEALVTSKARVKNHPVSVLTEEGGYY